MKLVINGVHILFSAIESFKHDEYKGVAVIRTVSGAEYEKVMKDKAEFNRLVARVVNTISIAESVGHG